ncbi:MAG: fumarylacetoacetate hydrolase family protein [Anaerolineaceae bacterium]|nr:fumarylacetoacetate hydrolase family protein [Anaerolineaceae bacterium]
MIISRLLTPIGPRWALDEKFLPESFTLNQLLDLPAHLQADLLNSLVTNEPARGDILAPIEEHQEVWASGVTFLRSRQAREAESATGDIYQRVYLAERPELFYKSCGWRVINPKGNIRIRSDSRWNVPEPELVLVLNRLGEICGYCAGNDVSSRDIEGENPLYLPQAKVYNGSCALGPKIVLETNTHIMNNLPIRLDIFHEGSTVYSGETSTQMMKRSYEDLASYLFKELSFPTGVFLMTGTGIVPPETFSLQTGDTVKVSIGEQVLENTTVS